MIFNVLKKGKREAMAKILSEIPCMANYETDKNIERHSGLIINCAVLK
jgi:hypothetical protein